MEHAATDVQPWMLRTTPVRLLAQQLRTRDGVGGYLPSAVMGDPARATREKGGAILTAMAADVVQFCDMWRREPNS